MLSGISNEMEIKKLYEIDNFDESAKEISSITEIAALTRGENGAKIYNDKEVILADIPGLID